MRRCLALIGLALLCALPARAATPQEQGLSIAREADRRDQGFGDSTARLVMVLSSAAGQTSVRELTMRTLEVTDEDAGDKSLIVFEHPGDVAGTALLTYAGITGDDDQWIYLPAIRRVKRIASSNRAGPFVGSEFAYEDMTAPEVDRFDYRYLRDEPCGALTCFVIERTPRFSGSGYSRQLVWIDTADYRTWRIDYFDRRGAALKTLRLSDYRQYQGRFWRAHDLVMDNHQTGKSTRLVWSEFRFGAGLKPADFTRASLSRQ